MFTYSLKYAKIDNVVMTGNRNLSKREVLRALMSIFDPLVSLTSMQRLYYKKSGGKAQIGMKKSPVHFKTIGYFGLICYLR